MRSKMRPPNDVIESKYYKVIAQKMVRLVLIGSNIGAAFAYQMLTRKGEIV